MIHKEKLLGGVHESYEYISAFPAHRRTLPDVVECVELPLNRSVTLLCFVCCDAPHACGPAAVWAVFLLHETVYQYAVMCNLKCQCSACSAGRCSWECGGKESSMFKGSTFKGSRVQGSRS